MGRLVTQKITVTSDWIDAHFCEYIFMFSIKHQNDRLGNAVVAYA